VGPGRPRGQEPAHPHRRHPDLDPAAHQRLDDRGRNRRWEAASLDLEEWEGQWRHAYDGTVWPVLNSSGIRRFRRPRDTWVRTERTRSLSMIIWVSKPPSQGLSAAQKPLLIGRVG
jgi:hypothetical protein